MSKQILLKNGLMVTMDKERRIIQDGAVAIQDNKIVAVGKTADEEALDRGVQTMQLYKDVRSTYPDTIQSVSAWTLAGYLKGPVQAVIDGTWEQYWEDNGIGQVTFANGGVEVRFGSMVPQDVIDYCNEAKTSIINGELSLEYDLEWPS